MALVDADPLTNVVKLMSEGKDMSTALKGGGQPNLTKRGNLRTIVDGKHKFTRYFGPVQHNTPTTIDDLYKNNDVELFDLEKDPGEMTNLAMTKGGNASLVSTMNTKLNALIKDEIGKDDGHELPDTKGISWVLASKAGDTILD